MKIIKAAMAVIGLLSLSACAQTVISLPPYTPTGTQELAGGVNVQEFKYTPKSGVAPNVIHNTAAGQLKLTEPVSSYITNAVKREFRQAGLSIKADNRCSLQGEINDLTIDDLGFSATYLSDFRYVLWDENKKTLLDNVYKVKFDTTKFVVAEVIFANINKVISSNIEELMSDKAFQKAITTSCGTT
ncbi:MAG: hypothetical protein E6Q98_09985 [Rhodospirillaceae bacterium]|nr:MAG: hypothetical protein E6Q98_09985 [Rhodospirillaceae bacterium]